MSAALGVLILLAVAGLWVLGWRASRDVDASFDIEDARDGIESARKAARRRRK